jgi:uncharacterized surface protein with fasciclin (FAS1) repeats
MMRIVLRTGLCLALALTLSACADQTGGGGIEQDTMASVPTDTAGMSGQAGPSVVQAVQQEQNLGQFGQALQTAGLAQSLERQGPYTIFAPSDSAFQALPKQQRQSLMQEANRQKLRNILTYHVVSGQKLAASDLQSQSSLTTMQGGSLKISQQGQNLMIGNARVVQPGIQAGNGIIHVVDAVLMPQTGNASSPASSSE